MKMHRPIQSVTSDVFAFGKKIHSLRESFTAGLIAIRVHPHIKKGDTLYHDLVEELTSTKPTDGGGWRFFAPHETEGELIVPDADTTAVCWSALLLLGKTTPIECHKAFQMVCSSLELGGDLYFDGSGRVDVIALCNMVFFVLLFTEINIKSSPRKKVSMESKEEEEEEDDDHDGIYIHRMIELICHVMKSNDPKEFKFWMRYYAYNEKNPKATIWRFIVPIVLRWPGQFPSLEALEPKEQEEEEEEEDTTVFHTPTRSLVFKSSGFYDSCAHLKKCDPMEYKGNYVPTTTPREGYERMDLVELMSSSFEMRLKELVDHCVSLPDDRIVPFWTKDAASLRTKHQSKIWEKETIHSHLDYEKLKKILSAL